MKRLVIAMTALLALLGAQSAVLAQESRPRSYELPNVGVFELTVPSAWIDSVDQPVDGGPPTIELKPATGPAFEIYLSPNWPNAPDETVPDAETLREQVRAEAGRMTGEMVGQNPEIRRLQGASGVGYYFVAADPSLQPEEFRYMNQGLLQVGDLTVTFTILTNEGQEAVIEEALAMLKSAIHRDTGLDQR
ncbi:MAG: hypothetical protein ACRER4_01230 [Steroidobacteraceae bacterium]